MMPIHKGQLRMEILLLFTCAAAACSALPDDFSRDERELLKNDPATESNVGQKFALAFIGNSRLNPQQPIANANFYISTNDLGGADVNISFPNTDFAGFPQTVNVIPGRTEKVIFPSAFAVEDVRVNSPQDTLNGILVESTADVNIIGVNDESFSTDGFLALPCEDFKPADKSSNLVEYKYFIFSTFSETTSSSVPFNSRILIVPCEANNANIEIALPGAGDATPPNVGNLMQYETYMFEQTGDLTGAVVTSRSPLSVFSGHECGQVPSNVARCSHLVEQIPAHAVYGRMFFTVPFALRESGDLYRIGSVIDNNVVNVTCTRRRTAGQSSLITESGIINRGKFFSHRTSKKNEVPGLTSADYRRDFCCIETSKPAIVMQYSLGHTEDMVSIEGITGQIGDPSMTLVPPVEQYRNDYTINTFDDVLDDLTNATQEFRSFFSWAVASQFIDLNTVGVDWNIMVNNVPYPQASLGSGEYVPIRCKDGNICGYGAFGPLPVGDSTISFESTRDPTAGVYASIYGFARENSYAYPAGYQCEPIGLPQVSVYDVIVNEQAGNITVPFNRTGGDLSFATQILANTVEVPDGMALVGSDFMAITNRRVRWMPNLVEPKTGTTNDTSFTITIIDDDIGEPTEYLEVHFTVETTGYAFPDAVARVTILDDDTLNISLPAAVNVSEGVANGTVQVCAELSGGSADTTTTTAINATLATSESSPVSAVADSDYPIASFVVNFVARSKDGSTQCVNVAITDDNVLEGDETFTVSLTVTAGDHTLGNAVTIVTIIDDDDVTVSVPAMGIADRKNGMVEVCATLSAAEDTERNFTITVATSDDTAIAGSDYASISSDKVFTSGSPDGANRCVDITILATSFEELVELNFTLILTTSDHGVMLGNDVTTIVITGSVDENGPGLRPEIIAAIVIVVLVFIMLCFLCSLCLLCHCRRRQKRKKFKADLVHNTPKQGTHHHKATIQIVLGEEAVGKDDTSYHARIAKM